MRDAQRQKVYDAENRARHLMTQRGWEWRDVKSEARYNRRLAEIMGSEWMQKHYPDAYNRGPVRVKWGEKRSGACAGAWGISTSVTDFALHELVLVHELAHTIEKRTTGVYDPGHGRAYCQIYLRLVKRFIGKAVHDELRAQFKLGRVRYTPKRKSSGSRALPVALAAANESRRQKAIQKFWNQLNATWVMVPGRRGWKIEATTGRDPLTGEVVIRFTSERTRTKAEIDYSTATPERVYESWRVFVANERERS